MAWQLIYTSAPRLLEAGRSGFGTVARHRQISPLLVSAIERASQFARLQGLDANRTIFCHRIIAVAGARFHVLSCIRDAGADYTGRTNHIAHHVVAEPSEVAALGARGPSAAEVLLAIPWRETWDEAPRFFETEDEIALGNCGVHIGENWARLTGDQRNAWLLASGEASRGAYILRVPEMDLRLLFAESLRLTSDKLWQISFTTALQPSDEISDFRWIGIDADSPLRAQAETSPRTILDLTNPRALPVAEVPANAAIIGIPRPTAVAASSAQPSEFEESSVSKIRKLTPMPALATRKKSKWIFAGIFALLVFCAAFFAIQSRIETMRTTHDRQEALRRKISEWHVFSPQFADFFSSLSGGKLSSADAVLDEIQRQLSAVKSSDFEKMRECKSGDEVEQTARAFGIEIPVEVIAFADRVRQLGTFDSDISKATAASERVGEDSLQRDGIAIESFAKEAQAQNIFSAAIEELRTRRERAAAALLLAMLHPRDSPGQNSPPVEIAFAKECLGRGKPADPIAAKSFAQADSLVKAWDSIQGARTDRARAEALATALQKSRADWPEWLVKQAEAVLENSRNDAPLISTQTKPPENFSALPIYVFNGIAAIKDARFQELERGFTFQLRAPLESPAVILIDPAKQGKLHRSVSEPALFAIDETGKTITPQTAAEKLPQPFALVAKSGDGRDAMQLWIVKEADKPVLSKKSAGIRRSGNSLLLDASQLAIPGVPKSRVTLRLPQDCAIAGKKLEPIPLKNWAADLAPLRDELALLEKETRLQIATLESFAKSPSAADVSTRFNDWKKAVEDAVNAEIANWAAVERTRIIRKEGDETKREPLLKILETKRLQRVQQLESDLGSASAELFQQAGGCIKAFSHDATFQGHDALFSAGAALSFIRPGTDEKGIATAFAMARRNVQASISSLVTSEEKGRYLNGLHTLEAMIVSLSPETLALKAERSKQTEHVLSQLAAQQELLRRIAAHPLLSDRVPPGVYLLSVFADGVEIPLVEIEVHQ